MNCLSRRISTVPLYLHFWCVYANMLKNDRGVAEAQVCVPLPADLLWGCNLRQDHGASSQDQQSCNFEKLQIRCNYP